MLLSYLLAIYFVSKNVDFVFVISLLLVTPIYPYFYQLFILIIIRFKLKFNLNKFIIGILCGHHNLQNTIYIKYFHDNLAN